MTQQHSLILKNLGIDTYKETVVYIHKDSPICRSEGFETQARIKITLDGRSILATLNTVDSNLLSIEEASLSTYAWKLLGAQEGKTICLCHPEHLKSHEVIRHKVNGHRLTQADFSLIIKDLVAGYLSDIYTSAFLTACVDGGLDQEEIFYLTNAMVNAGNRLSWSKKLVVDKHCVGGLPGNRTTMIVVPIVAEFGLVIPKTSSRAITSPAGTADTMEVLAPVELNLETLRRVVEQENGCIAWGGFVDLSPADDLFIRVEHALNIDSEGQLVASVLSKKVAAGSNHLLIDIPIGPTAKVKTQGMGNTLKQYFETVATKLGISLRVVFSDGSQPVGRGIGPALEAKNVLAILQNKPQAPADLRDRALTLAGYILEFSPEVTPGTGKQIATEILESGRAFKKFQAICKAQGGFFEPPTAAYQFPILSKETGSVTAIDNQHLAVVAKLAGAPKSKAAGIELLTPIGTRVAVKQTLFIIHAETKDELQYAIQYVQQEHEIITIKT